MSTRDKVRDTRNTQKPLRFVKMAETIERVQRSRAQIHRLIKAGAFPKPTKLGVNSIAFLEHELDQWIADRIAGKPMPAVPMTAKARARIEERREQRRAERDAGASA